MSRPGWVIDIDDELGQMDVHLKSEAAVRESEDGATWYVIDLDEEIVADGFETRAEAQAYVERRFEVEGHALDWPS